VVRLQVIDGTFFETREPAPGPPVIILR